MRNLLLAILPFVVVSTAVNAEDRRYAYAHVLGNGSLDVAHSKNVLALQGGSNGIYCFKLTFTPINAVATIATDPTAPNQGTAIIEVSLPPVLGASCGPGMPFPDSVVMTFNLSTNSSAGGHAFYVHWTE